MNDDLPVWQQPESRRLEFKEIFRREIRLPKLLLPSPMAPVAGLSSALEIIQEKSQASRMRESFTWRNASPGISPINAPVDHPGYLHPGMWRAEICWWSRCFPGFQKPYYLKSKGKSGGIYVRIGSTNKLALKMCGRNWNVNVVKFPSMPCLFSIFLSQKLILHSFKMITGKPRGESWGK